MEKLRPNFTQIPNYFLDELMSELSDSELKVLLYIMRRTYGFQKKGDKISISQLQKGITNSDGVQIDRGTGLSNRSIINAVRSLEKIGVILVKSENGRTKYFQMNTYEKSSQVEPMKNFHTTYEKFSREPMKNLHIQKKEKESIQNKEATPLPISQVISLFKDLNPAYKNWYGNKTQRKACEDLLEIWEFEKIEKLVLKVLPVTNSKKYAPVITTPIQLRDKLAQLKAFIEKEKLPTTKIAFV
jgi:hypothetical protein